MTLPERTSPSATEERWPPPAPDDCLTTVAAMSHPAISLRPLPRSLSMTVALWWRGDRHRLPTAGRSGSSRPGQRFALGLECDRAEISRAEAKRVLGALEDVVLQELELGNAQKVRIGGLVQLTVRVKRAQKARMGRNPATGKAIKVAAKPASVDVRARPLAKAKAGLPRLVLRGQLGLFGLLQPYW